MVEHGSDTGASDGAGEPVGGVAEEAARLFGALQDWARENGTDYADAAASAASGVVSSLGSVHEHVATGDRECRYCPVCRVIAAVRDTSPEVKADLTLAATSLTRAVARVMATQAPERHRNGGGRGGEHGEEYGESRVEKIDLDEGAEWDEDAWD